MPNKANLHTYPLLGRFSAPARRLPFLWSWKRPQVVRSYYVGWVVTLLPLGGVQLVLSLFLAIVFKANMPIAAGLQFVSNPLTAAPLLFTTFHLGKVGLSLFGVSPEGMAAGIALNLFVGAIVGGLMCGAACHLAHVFFAGRAQRRFASLKAKQITK